LYITTCIGKHCTGTLTERMLNEKKTVKRKHVSDVTVAVSLKKFNEQYSS